MGCCGQRRSVAARLGAAGPAPPPGPAPAPSQPAVPFHAMDLHYLKMEPVHVTGPVSGRRYAFSGARPVQPVDVRDVPGLLGTGLFRRGR